MNKNINNFLKLYEEISIFGPARIQGAAYGDSYLINFTEEDFYTQLYVNVPMEVWLKREIESTLTMGKLVALCGPAGSGKSTVSLITKRSLELSPKVFVIFADMRIQHSLQQYDDIETINEKDIRDVILNKFRKLFPVNTTRTPSKTDDLLYFILSPEDEISKYRDGLIFHILSDDNDAVSFLYRKSLSKNDWTFKEWYYQNLDLEELISIQKDVLKKLDIPHYVSFLKYTRDFNKIIIWLDNIDIFSNEQQILISNFLRNIQVSFLNSSVVVVSIREENIYRIGEFKDTHNEPFLSKVTFEDPDKRTEELTHYGAINVPVMDKENLRKVIRKKIRFTKTQYENCINKIKNDDNFSESQYGEYDFSENAYLTKEEFEEIMQFSDKLINIFDREKVIFLSNNSIKQYLQIHASFLKDVFTDENLYKELIAEKAERWKTTTIFLSWLHSMNKPFRLETFNVMEETERHKNKDYEIGCFLPYLILTRIWNECIKLTGRPSPHNNPNLRTVIKDIKKDFNYEEEDILDTIYNLYDKIGGRSNFITFRKKKKINEPNDIKNLDTTVRITYRGKVAIGNVINSFGYLAGCIFNDDEENLDETVVKNIGGIAKVHLISLQNIRNKNYKDKNNWIEIYLNKYGMPMEITFVRNSRIGIKYYRNKHRRSLYLETVFYSLQSYFKHRGNDKLREEVKEMSDKFNEYLNGLKQGKDFDKFNL